MRLAAFDNEEVLTTTWMDCLRDLHGHLTEIKNGVNVNPHINAAKKHFVALLLIVGVNSPENSCCLAANLNTARIVKFAEVLRGLGGSLISAIREGHSAQGAAELHRLIDLVLDGLPTEEVLEGIVKDFRLPYCPCSSCLASYAGAVITVMRCRHCHTLLQMGGPSSPLYSLFVR